MTFNSKRKNYLMPKDECFRGVIKTSRGLVVSLEQIKRYCKILVEMAESDTKPEYDAEIRIYFNTLTTIESMDVELKNLQDIVGFLREHERLQSGGDS